MPPASAPHPAPMSAALPVPRSASAGAGAAARPHRRRDVAAVRLVCLVGALAAALGASGTAVTPAFAGLRLPGGGFLSRFRRGHIEEKVALSADPERLVLVETAGERDVDLQGATVTSMDKLMREEAVTLLAAGAERTEQVGRGNTWYAFMPMLVLGPYKYQARLTCDVRLARSGGVHVDVVGFGVGMEENGKMVFSDYGEQGVGLTWENSVSWEPAPGRGQVLRLQHKSDGKLKMVLPWWFPLPDAMVRVAAKSSIAFMIKDGQSKVIKAIRQRHEATAPVPVSG